MSQLMACVAQDRRSAFSRRRRSGLAQHTKRLLLQRGFNDVRCPQPGLVSEACKGADLAIDLALEASGTARRRTGHRPS